MSLCRLAGFPICLGATVRLQTAGLLAADTTASKQSLPGNAFDCVYGKIAGRVQARVEAADPVLAGWIR